MRSSSQIKNHRKRRLKYGNTNGGSLGVLAIVLILVVIAASNPYHGVYPLRAWINTILGN